MEIEFGALCKPIGEQLQKQGHSITKDDAEFLQKLNDAIIILRLNKIITGSAAMAAEKNLLKTIVSVLSKE